MLLWRRVEQALIFCCMGEIWTCMIVCSHPLSTQEAVISSRYLNISGVLVAFISISILKKLQPQTSFWFTSTRIYSTHNRCTEDEIQAVMTPANRIIPQRDHCWIFLVVRTETKRKVVPGNESSFGSEVFVSLLSSGLKLIGSFLQHVVILLCFLCFTVCFASLPVLFCVNQRQGRW